MPAFDFEISVEDVTDDQADTILELVTIFVDNIGGSCMAEYAPVAPFRPSPFYGVYFRLINWRNRIARWMRGSHEAGI